MFGPLQALKDAVDQNDGNRIVQMVRDDPKLLAMINTPLRDVAGNNVSCMNRI